MANVRDVCRTLRAEPIVEDVVELYNSSEKSMTQLFRLTGPLELGPDRTPKLSGASLRALSGGACWAFNYRS